MQYANEEKNYKNEVLRQQGIISKLSEEQSLINIQLKENLFYNCKLYVLF